MPNRPRLQTFYFLLCNPVLQVGNPARDISFRLFFSFFFFNINTSLIYNFKHIAAHVYITGMKVPHQLSYNTFLQRALFVIVMCPPGCTECCGRLPGSSSSIGTRKQGSARILCEPTETTVLDALKENFALCHNRDFGVTQGENSGEASCSGFVLQQQAKIKFCTATTANLVVLAVQTATIRHGSSQQISQPL